jgi:FkbM family methyltransferase
MNGKPVYLDIGCGNGNRALEWLDGNIDAHAFCFDPLDECYTAAKKIAPQTKIKQLVRMHPVHAAITANTPLFGGSAKFYCANDRSSCSLLPFADRNSIKKWLYPPGRLYFKTISTITVPTMRMDKFLMDRRIDQIIFCRIETQGTSLDVLKSFGKRINNVMEFAIKVHVTDFDLYKGQTHKDELVSFMNSHGFIVYKTRKWSRDQEEVIWFVNKKAHKSPRLRHFDLHDN